jgi:uncharacterized repeat protein (TIGR01451 family)
MLLFATAALHMPASHMQAAQATPASVRYRHSHMLADSPTPRILLVDDDANDPDVRADYADALNGLGVAYDTWDTTISDEPSAGAIASYATVIWFTGLSGYPSETAEATLADFLDHGDCLFMSSQEYLYNVGSTPSAFMQQYLGVASADDDAAARSVSGVGSVFGGFGPTTLALPYENRTDRISPDATATLAFSGDNGAQVDSGVQKDAGAYRTTYWGFGLEGLPSAAERQDAIQRVLNWCSFQADLSIQQTATLPIALLPGQPLSYTLNYKNDGVAIASGVLLTDTLPTELIGLSISSSGPAINRLPGLPLRWQIANIAPGVSGSITIIGLANPLLTANVSATNVATLTTTTFDSDLTNNSTQAAFDVAVPRLAFSSAAYSSAEQNGAAPITVTIDAPNPFSDTSVAYATSNGSALAGSDYTTQAGTLTIPAGQTSASFSVPIIDDTEPESGETVLLRLSNPSGATLVAPSSATLTLLASDGLLSPQITSLLPSGAMRGVAYSHQFTASGLPQPSFTLAAGTLPPGLSLSTDGMLSGVPTQAGSYSHISVTASNGMAPDATQTFSIVVSAAGADVYLPLVVR